MKHKHHDKIVAKAANTGLVQFIKMDGEWENAGLSDKFISFSEEYDYFLCLPQHKEACLHWLSGGAIEVKEGGHWETCGPYAGSGQYWSVSGFLMNDEYEYRIKPKKEKRWIGVNVTTGKTTSAYTHDNEGNYAEDEVRLTNGNLSDWQFIEIEVEV